MTQTQSALCNEDRQELARVGYNAVELLQLEQFLTPFSRTARVYLARIFTRAKVRKKTFSEILIVCATLWDEDWKYGSPDRLGDPDDVAEGGVGMRNTCAFYDAYRQLGLPFPNFLF